LTEQYIQALNQILSNSKVLMLPPEHNSSNNSWSMNKIATSISLLKSVIGSEGFVQASQQNPDMLSQVQRKLAQLETE
jgi:hypothetical protein